MADTRTLEVIINGKNNLSGAFKESEASVGLFSKAAHAAGETILKLSTAITGLTLAASAFSTKSAIEFDTAMRNVDSIAKLSGESFVTLEKQVLEMSKTLPQSASVLARGLYDVYSSGFEGVVAMDVLKQAAIGASAGMTQTDVSARGLMAVMNAYGQKTGPDAQKVMDVLFQTVNRGVITFEELASQIGDVTSIAAVLEVPVEQVGAGFAVLTKNGINGAESATALAGVLRSLLKPSQQQMEAAAELGIQWDMAALKQKGYIGVMQDLAAKGKGHEDLMAKIAGDARAVKAAFILSKDGAQEFTKELEYMNKAGGAATGALERQAQGTAFQFGILKNNVTALATEIGLAALPQFNSWIKETNDFVTKHSPAFIDGIIKWRTHLDDITDTVVEQAQQRWPAWKDAALKAVNTVSPIMMGYLDDWKARSEYVWSRVSTTVTRAWEQTGVSSRNGVATMTMFLNQFRETTNRLWNIVLRVGLDAFDGLVNGGVALWNALAQQFGEGKATVMDFINEAIGKFEYMYMWIRIKGQEFIGNHRQDFLDFAAGVGNVISDIQNAFTLVWFHLRFEGTKFWNEYGDNILNFGKLLQTTVTNLVKGFKQVWDATKEPIGNLMKALGDLIKPILELTGSSATGGLTGLNALIKVVFEGWSKLLPPIISAVVRLVEWIKSAVEGLNELIRKWPEFVKSFGDGVAKLPGIGVSDAIGDFFDFSKNKKAMGGMVTGFGAQDTVPALLTPGEEVLRRNDPRNARNGGGGGLTVNVNGTFYGADRNFARQIGDLIVARINQDVRYAR